MGRANSSKAIEKLDTAIREFVSELAAEEGHESGVLIDFFLGFAVLDKNNHVDYSYAVPPNSMIHSSIGLANLCSDIMAGDAEDCDECGD